MFLGDHANQSIACAVVGILLDCVRHPVAA